MYITLQKNQSQEYMKHSIYFRDVSTLYLSHFQSVDKATLNNSKPKHKCTDAL